MIEDDEHRPALRSYDEFEGRRRKKKKKRLVDEGEERKARTIQPDAKKITEDALREAALRYLDRQDASVHQMRQVLQRRISKYGDEETRGPAKERVEELLERLQSSNILDDARYARGLSESLRRRGASLPKVRLKLNTRGLSEEHQTAALEALSGDDELGDEASADTYARKRRLRERYDLSDRKQREKALAALARQGFSFDVAKKVLGL